MTKQETQEVLYKALQKTNPKLMAYINECFDKGGSKSHLKAALKDMLPKGLTLEGSLAAVECISRERENNQ